MFTAIAPLLAAGEELNLKIVGMDKDGVMKVVVMPKAVKGGNVALAAPIALAATPQELDSEFVSVIAGYAVERTSLQEQLAVTATLIAAAKQDAAAKGTKALHGKSAPALNAPAPNGDDDDEAGNGGDVLDGEDYIRPTASAPETSSKPAPVPAPAASGSNDDLLSLLGI
jgi:PRTRC genetic system protein E